MQIDRQTDGKRTLPNYPNKQVINIRVLLLLGNNFPLHAITRKQSNLLQWVYIMSRFSKTVLCFAIHFNASYNEMLWQ